MPCEQCKALTGLIGQARAGRCRLRDGRSAQAEISSLKRLLSAQRRVCGCGGPGKGGVRRSRKTTEPWIRLAGRSHLVPTRWSSPENCLATLTCLCDIASVTVLPPQPADWDANVHWQPYTKQLTKIAGETGYYRVELTRGPVPDAIGSMFTRVLPSGWELTGTCDAFVSMITSFSGTHWDQQSSLLQVLCGHKTVLLHKPDGGPPTWPQNTRWSLFSPFSLTSAEVVNSGWKQYNLGRGDMLFIPHGWWHHIASIPGTLAITVEVQVTLTL